jgi:hypothetical protein
MTKLNIPLSASRIKTLQTCSWQYYANYILKLPSKSNHGSLRGGICHAIFENLGNPRHKHHYNKIVKENTVFASKAISRMVLAYVKKYKIDDEDNVKMIDSMTLEGLKFDFFGKENKGLTKALSEEKFDLNINEDGKNYRILGFIDKLFLFKKEGRILIRDFKTSKGVFEGKEATDNMQDLMYSLAVKYLYPDFLKRNSEFLFIKFDCRDKGHLKMEQVPDDELEGFEYFLTEVQKVINNFDIKTARSNFAYDKGYPKPEEGFAGKLVCGRANYEGQLKKDGTLMWHCPYRFSSFYYHIFDKNKNFIKSVEEEDFSEQNVPEGGSFEMKFYAGCEKFIR